MGFVLGGDLGSHRYGNTEQKNPAAPESLLLQLGESIAFQVFVHGWDRWPLKGFLGDGQTRFNAGNMMVTGSGDVVLIDTDTQAVVDAEAYQKSLEPLIQKTLDNDEGDTLIGNAAKVLESMYIVDATTNKTLRAGFIRFLRTLKITNFSALHAPPSKGDDEKGAGTKRDAFLASMQKFMVEKLDALDARKK
jgi:hypothetical protein